MRLKYHFGTGTGDPIAPGYYPGSIRCLNQGVKHMKGVCILIAAALIATAPLLLWSEETTGASLYEEKCSMCHGSKGEGNPEAGLPAVAGTTMTVDKLITYLTKGDKEKTIHADPVGDLNEDQAKAVAEYVKVLKKQEQ
jgi:mono/diheme cytochrome c family protein